MNNNDKRQSSQVKNIFWLNVYTQQNIIKNSCYWVLSSHHIVTRKDNAFEKKIKKNQMFFLFMSNFNTDFTSLSFKK